MKIGYKSPKKVVGYMFGMLANLPMPGGWRWRLYRLMGVNFVPAEGQKKFTSFIGKDVKFDSVHPELVFIGNHVHLTGGCVLLTHYLDTKAPGISWKEGEIHIGEDTFVGMNTIIAKPCNIGRNVIIGAGSVVTKDIPDNEIWAGNPARFIRKRD